MSDTLTLSQAAEMAGVNRNTLTRAMRAGTIPVPILKIGKSVRVPRQKFTAWLTGEIAGGEPRSAANGPVESVDPPPAPGPSS